MAIDVWAHRFGRGKGWGPENTRVVIEKALSLRVGKRRLRGAETDMSVCKSGELVDIHNYDLSLFGDKRRVCDVTYDELLQISAGAYMGEEFAGERVPLVRDVLNWVAGRFDLNLELKNTPVAYPGIEEKLAQALRTYCAPETVVVSSFDQELLLRFKNLAPRIKTGLLGNFVPLGIEALARDLRVSNWHPYYMCMRPDLVERAHKAGLSVHTWTLNEVWEWELAISFGVDGIITDNPQELLEFLESSGL